jgi:hypothetical protein
MIEIPMDFHEIDPAICYLDHAKEATLSPFVKLAGWKAIQRSSWTSPQRVKKPKLDACLPP